MTDGGFRGSAVPLRRLPSIDRVAAVALAGLAAGYLSWLLGVSRLFTSYLPEDWKILVSRADPTFDSLFAPLNGHWFTTTTVVYEVLIRTFGLGSYLPFLLVQTAAHLVCVALVFLVVRRHAGPAPALAAGSPLLLFSSAYHNLYWLVMLGFVAPTALALAALLLAETPIWTRPRWVAIAALLLLGVMSSGVGLVMLLVVAVTLLGSRRILVIVPALLAYVAWALLWPSAFQDRPGEGDPIAYVAQAAGIVGQALFSAILPGEAIVLAIAVVATVAVVAGWRPHRWPWAGAAGVVALYAGVGFRADWLPVYATPGHYLYPVLVCILVGLAPILRAVPRPGQAVLSAAFLVALVHNIEHLPATAIEWERSSLFFRAQTTVVEQARIRSPAFIEPYGLHVYDYLDVVDRFGAPACTPELERRLARPEMQVYADAMRRRLAE